MPRSSKILLKLPDWAAGLPLGGKAHSGPHYLAPPEQAAEPLVAPNPDDLVIEAAVDSYIVAIREDIGAIDDPALVEHEDDEDFVASLADNVAALTELVGLPLTSDNKVSCPFHDDSEPSCAIYPDHFHCFGCGERGSRLDWLMRVEGMTATEAVVLSKDWPGPQVHTPRIATTQLRNWRLSNRSGRRPNRCAGRPSNACKHG